MDSISVKVLSGGRLTIPVEIRRKLALNTGDYIGFEKCDDGFILVPIHTRDSEDVSEPTDPGLADDDPSGPVGDASVGQ